MGDELDIHAKQPPGPPAAEKSRIATFHYRIDPTAPREIARYFLITKYGAANIGGRRELHFWTGNFYEWRGACYTLLAPDVVRARLYEWLAIQTTVDGAAVKPTRRLVDNVIDALRACAILEVSRMPCWINKPEPVPANEAIAFSNGLLHIRTRRLLPHNLFLFSTNAIEFNFDPHADPAINWVNFLDDVFADDAQVSALQEWLGYVLTGETDQQKAALMVGPIRSGKGTIARVTRALVGASNCCAPTLATLTQPFGLAGLIGKQLAILSDVRLSTRSDLATITENILRITGEDSISVDRKFLPQWDGQLGVRFFVLSNELPAFSDTSGALASRFLLFQTKKSFYGLEDLGLTERLLQELPGILNWALDGLDRLRRRGHFVQPESSREALAQLDLLGSPVKAFLADCVIIEPGASVLCADLFSAWVTWCNEQRRDKPGTQQLFGRNLSAAVSALRVVQRRDELGARHRWYEGVRLRGNSDKE